MTFLRLPLCISLKGRLKPCVLNVQYSRAQGVSDILVLYLSTFTALVIKERVRFAVIVNEESYLLRKN